MAASLVIDLVAYLADRGLAPAEVCRAARLDPAWLESPDARVPGSAVERLWEVGETLSADPDLGLHAAAVHNPGALDILGYVALNCRTAAEMLAKLARFAALLNDGLRVELEREDGLTVCRFEAVAGLDNYLLRRPRQVLETLAAGVLRALAELPLEPVRAREVSFRHAAPVSTAEHRCLFGVEPRFGQAVDRLVFRSADLERPLRSAHPALLAVFERHAEALLARLDDLGPLGRRALTAIGAGLRGGLPVLGEVAGGLAMSARNLQRGLAAEGTSFQELLDRARRELALRHLATPAGSVAEVAFLLGFSDASAFTRAFRRWTGTTPGEWRAKRGAGAATPGE